VNYSVRLIILIYLVFFIIIMNSNCPFKELCQICDKFIFENCCLFKTYIENDFKICKKIRLCLNLFLCEDAINGNLIRKSLFNKIIPTLDDIKSFKYNVKNPFKGFKRRFIPRIEVYGESSKNQMKIIKKLGIDFIAVSLKNLISNSENKILKKNFENNLHDILDYDGKILLLTIIPDYYCLKIIKNSQKYVEALNLLQPDVITTFDANFYLDQPLFINFIQTLNILKANLAISNLEIPQIFLLPPVPLPLFECIFEVFLQSNHKSLCIPAGEFRNPKDPHLLKIIDFINYKKDILKKKFELLLISKSPNERIYANCYLSDTWAKYKKKNKRNGLKIMEEKLKKTIRKAERIKFQKSIFSYLRKEG